MKKEVRVGTSFKKLLKEMEPYVKDFSNRMLKERKFQDSSLRPIEVWGNWLLCAVLRKNISGEITIADDGEGDGIILDRRTGYGRQTEHVCAVDNPSSRKLLALSEKRIISAINQKIDKQYGDVNELVLVVFFDGEMKWYRNKVREAINERNKFKRVYLIGLLAKNEEGFAYSVTELHENDSITFKVQINPDFTSWSVEKIQEPN